MNAEMRAVEDPKSGQEVAKHGIREDSRFHVEYWKRRLYHNFFTRDGVRHELPEWSVRLQHLGRREAFALGTANAALAAGKAKEIATYLDANGWPATISKFKPSPAANLDVATVGEFLRDVETRSHLRPATFRRYATKLRTIVAAIGKVDAGVRGKAARAKYDYVNGGRNAWLAKVDGQSLSILTPDAVIAWRNKYVARAGVDPLRRKSAERSAASYLRCSRALFTPDVVAVLKVKLPPSPFAVVKLKDPGPQRYHSDIKPELLLVAAEREMREAFPQVYLALFLCLMAGLRRKEADLLLWDQVDFDACRIHVRRTPYFEPKTEESQRAIDLSTQAMDVLRTFKPGSTSEFVLRGGEPRPEATYDYYRCDGTWRGLNAWLQLKGVRDPKAIHSLRKESGSLIASQFGIEAARQHLGHRDIRTTSAHYTRPIGRREIDLPIANSAELLRRI